MQLSSSVECVIKCVIEYAACTVHVQDIVLALRVSIAECETRHGIRKVVIVALGVGYGHLLADNCLTSVDVDDIDLIGTEEVVSPVGHGGCQRSSISLEDALLCDAVVDRPATYDCSITDIFWSHLMFACAINEFLTTKRI